jgi:hypothetical protein
MALVLIILAAIAWANRRSRRRWTAVGITVMLAIAFVRPPEARGLGLLDEIMAVLITINTTIGNWLSNIRAVQNDMRQIQQATVWPQQMIQQAHVWAASWLNTYKTPMLRLFSYRPMSGTLSQTLQLEQVLMDGNSANLSVLLGRYRQLYGPVPSAPQMKPTDRDMTDMNDALTLDTLEQLKRGDEVNQSIRATGDSLEEMTTSAVPGTAPFLTATALVTMLKSQAVTQKMLAAYLRQTSAQLAYQTNAQKQAVQATIGLHHTITNTLAR